MSDGYHHDGDFTRAVQQGAVEPLVDNETHSILYRVRYWQSADTFKRLPLGSRGPFGSWMVEPAEVTRDIGGGLLEFDRLFAVVPAAHDEYESYVYAYQQVLDSNLIEIPVPVTSRVRREYYRTTTPATIEQLRAYRLMQFGENIYYIGTPPEEGALEILAENSSLKRWRGTIYVRESRYVKIQEITAHEEA